MSSPAERSDTDALVRAVHETFGSFSDSEGSEYHTAGDLSPEETWRRITVELARVCGVAARLGESGQVFGVVDLQQIHEGIFAPVFGEALSLRDSKHERVVFPIVLGPLERPLRKSRPGAYHKQVERRLRDALRDFELSMRSFAERGSIELADAVEAALRLYVRILRTHPWIDGNGRTAWCSFVYALQRCDIPIPQLPPTLETRIALGRAIHNGAEIGILRDIVLRTIRESAE